MRFTVVVLFGLALGCDKPKTPAPLPNASVQVERRLSHALTSEEQSSATAFDLFARPDGLHVAWASAAAGADWLREAELGQGGELRGAVRRLSVPPHALGKISDLAVTGVGEQLALAWLEQGEKEARAQATLSTPGSPAPLLDLGPAALVSQAARGNIAIAAEPERARALVLWRGLPAPCVQAQQGPCTGFTFRRIATNVAETTGLPLSVPVPCASHSVGLATAPGRFHYGVCTREGSDPVTTMFSIQYDPEYARAEPLLKGCLPLGTLDVEGRAWLIGDCHGKRRASPVPLMDEKVDSESIDALAVTCTAQRLELRQGRFALRLREPRAGLESVLPQSLVPTGARVGWTGSTLVAVYPVGARLETQAYACRDGKLQPLP
jgi:hypothetical protein